MSRLTSLDRSISSLSISSADSQPEDDWDRSLIESEVGVDDSSSLAMPFPTNEPASPTNAMGSTAAANILSSPNARVAQILHTTPRNSVVFPAEDTPGRTTRYTSSGYHSKNGSVDGMGNAGKGGKRTLSELLRLHSEKNTNGMFSAEEASRIADVLGQWVGVHNFILILILLLRCLAISSIRFLPLEIHEIALTHKPNQQINASSSPYEGEDDFFSRSHSQDDIRIASATSPRRAVQPELALGALGGRPRGRSESVHSHSHSRPGSALGAATAV